MALGNATFSAKSGGGKIRASSQQLARAIVHLDVCTLGAPNTVIEIGDPSSIPTLLGQGRGAELCAFTARNGQSKYFVPLNPSAGGAVGVVAHTVGSGAGTITPSLAPHKPILVKCMTGGALGTATFQFSLDGGVTWSAIIASVAGSTWAYRVLGTFCTLTFPTATYVATKTLTVGIDGTVTPGSAWVGGVTQLSSPVDDYEVAIAVVTGGALGAAVLQVSLDAGISTMPGMLVPNGGVVVIPGTGIVLTCANAFVQGDAYSFLAIGPAPTTQDIQNALTALRAVPTVQASMVHLGCMPSSAAGAFSAAATLDAAVLGAFQAGSGDWEAACDCPSNKGGMRIVSALTGRKHLRPLSWLAMDRYVDTDPKDELAAVALGALRCFFPAGASSIAGPGDIVASGGVAIYDTADGDAVIIAARGADLSGRTSVFVGGRDEALQPALDDVQINTVRTYGGPLAAYLSITAGVIGWKNLTTDVDFVDAGTIRAMNIMIAALRPVAITLLGQRPKVNPDGTIAEGPAAAYDTMLDGAVKRALGLQKGGDFPEPQASSASASVLRSSQLGQNPKRLDIAYQLQGLGEVTDESNAVSVSGVLSVSG